jgi:hypothetical protein
MKINSYNLLAPISLQIIPRNGDLNPKEKPWHLLSLNPLYTWPLGWLLTYYSKTPSPQALLQFYFILKKKLEELFLLPYTHILLCTNYYFIFEGQTLLTLFEGCKGLFHKTYLS